MVTYYVYKKKKHRKLAVCNNIIHPSISPTPYKPKPRWSLGAA